MAAANTDKFKKSKRKFETTVGVGGILAAGTTLPLTSVTGLDTSTAVTLVIGAGTATEEVVTGVVSGSDLINCVRGKEGTTDSAHSAGETVNMFFTETHWDDAMDGILVEHDQDGTHGAVTATSVTATTGTFTNLTVSGTATSQGWTALGDVPDTVTANGNRNYDLVFNGVDHTSTLSPGMKLQLARTVAAPDQCTSLNGTTQGYSKSSPTGVSFTNTWTVSAWIKTTAYQNSYIISRSSSANDGWEVYLNTSGQLVSLFRGAGSTYKQWNSYASVPLNKWVHVAVSHTASTNVGTAYFDGVAVDGIGSVSGGTPPTTITQGGDLNVGGVRGNYSFAGKLAQVAVYSAVIAEATIKNSMDRTLTGSETSLISAYSFDNSINDLNANANNLTAQGSAVATATDSPFANAVAAGTQEYAEINSVVFSTNTTVNVRVADTCQIPTTGGVSAVNYSTQSNPFGLPRISNVLAFIMVPGFTVASTSRTAIPGLTTTVKVPPGRGIKLSMYCRYINGTSGDLGSFEIHDTAVSSSTNIIQGADVAVDAGGGPSIHLETIEYPSTSTTTTTSKTYIGACVNNTAARNLTYNGEITSTYRRPLFLKVELV